MLKFYNNIKQENPIGLFDSGSGGITVLKQLKQILPNENYVYIADTKNVPYGAKPKSFIQNRSVEIVNQLLKFKCKIIVFACNYSSSVSEEILKKKFKDIEIISLLNSKTLNNIVKNEHKNGICLLATKGTVKAGTYKNRITQLNGYVPYYQKACVNWVDLIENNSKQQDIINEIKKTLAPFVKKGIEVFIYGCTHYPLLENYIKKEYPFVKMIDPAKTTSVLVKETLIRKNLLNNRTDRAEITIYKTGKICAIKKMLDRLKIKSQIQTINF